MCRWLGTRNEVAASVTPQVGPTYCEIAEKQETLRGNRLAKSSQWPVTVSDTHPQG